VSTRAYISVGSNVEAERHIASALDALRARYGSVIFSNLYQTPAAGFEGDDFLNLALAIDTDESPATIMGFLRELEASSGRVRGGAKFSARTLDLDLLTYGALVSAEPGPVLPRADILDYDFVLGPLAEIAGDERHPQLQETYRELWDAMRSRTGPLHLFAPAGERTQA
jgi:2-amino-4-hydroxy-6-hydroxymethyldihydropteridine diphosphokinase